MAPITWNESETKLTVLTVILRKSRKQGQTIAATSIQEIKNDLKKYYDKDLSERQILNVTQSLKRIVIKEKDPRDHRKTLYRINPNAIKELSFTLVKLNNENKHNDDFVDGILYYPISSVEKKRFLAISH